MDLRTRVLVETRSTVYVVSLAPLPLISFERRLHCCLRDVNDSGVTVTSVIVSPVAVSPQLVCPSVHSCIWHCPEHVTAVAAVVFVPLSPVDSVSSSPFLALYCVIP